MSYKIEREAAQEIVSAIKAAGFRAFLAESGTYGFYTDADGTRVVSFECNGLRDSVSGNYKTSNPRQTGTGWRIAESFPFDADTIDSCFRATAPRWAVGSATWKYTTLEQHLDTYQKSSKYKEQ